MNMDIPVFITPKQAPKLYTEAEDQFLRDHFPTKTHKHMAEKLGRSVDSIKNRCRLLKLTRPARMVVALVRTGQPQPAGRDLSELPPHIQKWFGLVPGFEPGIGRHIQESLPDIPMRKSKTHIGCGTQYLIGELANL